MYPAISLRRIYQCHWYKIREEYVCPSYLRCRVISLLLRAPEGKEEVREEGSKSQLLPQNIHQLGRFARLILFFSTSEFANIPIFCNIIAKTFTSLSSQKKNKGDQPIST
jgi:hypothetical protein